MTIKEEILNLLTKDKTMIAIDPGFGPKGFFNINEAIVLEWGLIAFFLILCLWLTHGMKVHGPSRKQVIVETVVVGLRNLIGGALGENGKRYTDFLVSVVLFIGFSNMVGVLGFKPPTMDLNTTAGLALTSIILVEAAGIIARGPGGWLKSFAHPIAVVAPMNVLEIGIRPLSLCMRLFGNILGATVIMELIKLAVPILLPAALSLYFDFFDGLLQAYVFVFLTSLYIKDATEIE